MALDTTVGGASADSYISVAEADAIAVNRLGREAEAWQNAQVVDKERALRQAAVDIDTLVNGRPYSDAQMLGFPRYVDTDDSLVPFIPARVRQAQYEQAAYLLANADVISDAASRRARGLFSFAEDNLSGSIALDDTTGLLAPRAMQLMRSISNRSSSSVVSVPISTRTWPIDS